MRAASRSFRRLVITGVRSASVMRRSGRTRGSKMPPAAWRIKTVPSRWRSRMWFTFTAYIIVPEEGDRIFHIVPPRVWPALNGVMVNPWHFPEEIIISGLRSLCIYLPCRCVGCEYLKVLQESKASWTSMTVAMNFPFPSWAGRDSSRDSGFSSSTFCDCVGWSITSSSSRSPSTSSVTAILPIACTGRVV